MSRRGVRGQRGAFLSQQGAPGADGQAALTAGVFVRETFTGAGMLIDHLGELGAAWTIHPSYGGNLAQLTGDGRVRDIAAPGFASAYYASGLPSSPDYYVESEVTGDGDASSGTGPMGRLSIAADTSYLLWWAGGGANTWTLYRLNAGVATLLVAYAAPVGDRPSGTPVVARLGMSGSTIRATINGVLRLTVVDPAPILSAGRVGLRFFKLAGGNVYQSRFEAGA